MALSKNTNVTVIYKNPRTTHDVNFNTALNLEKEIVINKIIENAYHMVSNITGNKEILTFDVMIYNNQDKDVLLTNTSYNFIADISSDSTPNFYVQAYNYLKSLPEYQNAIDC